MHLAPELGLLRQLPIDSLAAALEKISDGWSRAGIALRIDLREEARKKALSGRCAPGFASGGSRLEERNGKRTEHGRGDENRGGNAQTMAPDELAQPIGAGVRTSDDGPGSQISPQVFGECRGRRIAPQRLMRQRLHGDRVEITMQLARRCGWRFGGFVLDVSGQLIRRRRAPVERQNAREELVEHDAQREHVGRRRHTAAKDLFRGRVSGRVHATALTCERQVIFIVRQDLRDAEIQQLHLAFGRHQDVRWLQIAMHDEAPVRGIHRVAAGRQEPQPIVKRQGRECGSNPCIVSSLHSLHDEGTAARREFRRRREAARFPGAPGGPGFAARVRNDDNGSRGSPCPASRA